MRKTLASGPQGTLEERKNSEAWPGATLGKHNVQSRKKHKAYSKPNATECGAIYTKRHGRS